MEKREVLCCPSQSCDQPYGVPAWAAGSGDGKHPILMQVGHLGEQYKAWVHKPVSGRPRFFRSTILESITMTPWWVVPLLWVPILVFCLLRSIATSRTSATHVLAFVASGFLAWQLLEYLIHRCAFHTIPTNYWGITAHFLFHGCHHKYPTDASRLVFPPVPAAAVALGIYGALQAAVPQAAVLPMFTGIASGYLAYDCLHYCMHHGSARGALAPLRKAHLHHHFRMPDAGFGISSPLFDILLGSGPAKLDEPLAAEKKTCCPRVK